MQDRSGDYNQGGGTRRQLMTAYRENAIFIACCLAKFGPLTPARLRELGTGPKTLAILSNNHYQWFQRVARGVYAITAKGHENIKAFPEMIERYNDLLKR